MAPPFSWGILVTKAMAAQCIRVAIAVAGAWAMQQGATTLLDDDAFTWVVRLQQALDILVRHRGAATEQGERMALVAAHVAVKSIVGDAVLRKVGNVTRRAFRFAAVALRDAVACFVRGAVGILH